MIYFRKPRPTQQLALAIVAALVVTLAAVSLSAAAPAQPDTQSQTPAAPAANPEFIVNRRGGPMATGGGFLYWSYDVNAPSAQALDADANAPAYTIGYVDRYPLNGGRLATLSDRYALSRLYLHANELGVYYYNGSAIVLRALSDPYTDRILVYTSQPQSPIVSDASTGMMYWISGGKLWWADRDEFTSLIGANEMTNAGANPNSLTLSDDGNLYWFGDGWIYYAYKWCLGGWGACVRNPLVQENGRGLLFHRVNGVLLGSDYTLHWISGSKVRAYGCWLVFFETRCGTSTTYDAQLNDLYLTPPIGYGQSIFWIEQGLGTLYGTPSELKRYEFGRFGSGLGTIAGGTGQNYRIDMGSGLAAANGWVFFSADDRIARIRYDAPPIQPDIELTVVEITQGVQNLNGLDALPIANKPTYVRVFARLVSGPRTPAVEAKIIGQRAVGGALGAIYPINGTRPIVSNFPPSRAALDGQTWLFALPDNWTASGRTDLTIYVNPRNAYLEPNIGNNTTARSVDFRHKAPVCIVFIRVRTARTAALFTPNHWFAIDMTKRQLPTPGVWTYSQSDDVAELEARFGIPPWKYGPYEPADDSGKILNSLWMRDQLSDDPDECDDARARTHYVGIVDPGESGNNGSGRLGGDQLWFRLPPTDFSADWKTDRAITLAHELGHNYGRRHVDCPPGDPDDTGAFPYPTCQIDHDDGEARHWGFTYNTGTARYETIPPTTVGDLMSYAHRLDTPKPRWISDFTWNGIQNEIPNGALAAQAEAIHRQPAALAPDLAQADAVILVTGLIDQTQSSRSTLDYATIIPTQAVSQNMVGKWQRAAAPTLADVLAAGGAATYHLRLLDPDGNLLDDRQITPFEGADDENAMIQAFSLTFPAPAGQVARLELMMDGDTVLASLQPGPNPPTVNILSPAGGETIDQNLNLGWQASDPDGDPLLFTVQYSPDDGQTWRALLTNHPHLGVGDIVAIPLQDLGGVPGDTTQARIRVLASDGFNTSMAVSEPFSVSNRKPQPVILSPSSTQPVSAPQTVILSGAAMDAEDGRLSGNRLSWEISGPMNTTITGAGEQLTLEGLGAGLYTITLTAIDSKGNSQTTTSTLTMAPVIVPLGNAPVFDGFCEDEVYTNAVHIPLRPYGDGVQPTVLLHRSNTDLYVCFTNLKRSGGASPISFATVRLDQDNSRETTPQPGDLEFLLYEDGVPVTKRGDGVTWLVAQASGVTGQVSADGSAWSAEVALPAHVLGGWNHVVNLNFDHNWVNGPFDDYRWPHRSDWWNPSTWSLVAFGAVPQATALAPATATVGDADFTLTVTGTGFSEGATVYWNGGAKPTTFVDATTLQAAITSADLTTAGLIPITVASAGLNLAPSAPLLFTVNHVTPVLSGADLQGTTLTITGSGFANGARILWEGLAQPTTFVDENHVQAEIDPGLIPANGVVGVAVTNPDPSSGPSQVLPLAVDAGEAGQRLYLPLVALGSPAPQ